MNPLLSVFITLLLGASPLAGQIYADFTVSTGTPPATTPLGTFRARLDHDKAPRPVANFIGLATGQRPWIDINTGAIKTTPYYDGQIFHRLDHSFVLQGGDILGTGQGGPGFVIQDQYHPDLRHSGRYILSMAKSGKPNSNGSQFFITLRATANLDDKHSVFGEVITNKSLIDDFADSDLFPTNPATEEPLTQINLDSVVISGPSLASFDLFDPSLQLPRVAGQPVVCSMDATDGSFDLAWDRGPQTLYTVSKAETLPSFTPLTQVYSASLLAGYSLNIAVGPKRAYFARIAAIDYGLVPNAPADLIAAGHRVALSDRSGNTLTLNFTGTASGSWSHSDSSFGTFTLYWAEDQVPGAGAGLVDATYPQGIPLYDIGLNFDGPGGPNNWTRLRCMLSFHDATSGWVEGTAIFPGDPPTGEQVLQEFTYTPAP